MRFRLKASRTRIADSGSRFPTGFWGVNRAEVPARSLLERAPVRSTIEQASIRVAYDVSRETVLAASGAVSGVSAPLQHPASATVKWSFIEAKSFHESRRKVPLRILRLAHAV